jgi:hypothetical protein
MSGRATLATLEPVSSWSHAKPEVSSSTHGGDGRPQLLEGIQRSPCRRTLARPLVYAKQIDPSVMMGTAVEATQKTERCLYVWLN